MSHLSKFPWRTKLPKGYKGKSSKDSGGNRTFLNRCHLYFIFLIKSVVMCSPDSVFEKLFKPRLVRSTEKIGVLRSNDEKKYKLIGVRKGKTNYARTNNRNNVTLGSYTRCNFPEKWVIYHLQIFPETRLEIKWNTTFWGQRNIFKSSPGCPLPFKNRFR